MTKQQTLLMLRKNIIHLLTFIFKKKWRMRILGAGIFLSLLAGKYKRFKQNLLTATIGKKLKEKPAHAYFEHPYFSKSFGGKIKILNSVLKDNNFTNCFYNFNTYNYKKM